MVSIIIPARNEQYLEATIKDILANAEGEIEILVMLDGYIPDPKIECEDDRVIFVHYPESIGQRQCINAGAKMAKGKYIMKLDAHCAVDKGFDVKLAKDCEPSWTVVPRMYNLDVATWKPKLHKRTDYMYITSPTAEKPFRAAYYGSKQPKNNKMIDDTMACMGPGWFMHKDRFFEQGGCDEEHGSWGAQSVEVSLKAWLSGGSLKVNKNTWFAHYFRGGVGFPYPISGRQVSVARKHSQDIWLNDKWDKATRKLSWVVEKFNPPTWGDNKMVDMDLINREIRKHFNTRIQNDFPPYAGIKGDRNTLLDLCAKLGFKSGVEIGVNRGHYSREMLQRIPGFHLTCIDPWAEYQYSHRTIEGQERDYDIAQKKLKSWIDINKCVLVKDFSQNVHQNYADESIDFLYIDGDHCFDGICLDLIYWVPKVKKGGIIAIHDYFNFRRGGVVDAVNAYTKNHMIKDWYTTKEVMPTAFWVK